MTEQERKEVKIHQLRRVRKESDGKEKRNPGNDQCYYSLDHPDPFRESEQDDPG